MKSSGSHVKKVANYWSNKAGGYNSKENRRYLFYEYNLRNKLAYDFTIKYCKNINGGRCRIVDFGCGNGVNLGKLSVFCSDCYGVDISDKMVKLAKKNAPKCFIQKIKLEEFAYEVDAVMAIGVYEYLDDPRLLFEASSRLLPQNGLLIFSFNKKDTILGKIEAWYRVKKKKYYSNKEHSLNNQYAKNEVLKLCESYNFIIEDVHDYGFRTNLFCVGPLKYFYPLIEIFADYFLKNKWLRSSISTNSMLVLSKR